MVKAKIGKTEIEGTQEEVAYVLNGLLAAQEEDTSVEVIHEAAPATEAAIRSWQGKPYKGTVPALSKMRKRYRWRGKRITYKNILGMPLQDWLAKNFPTLSAEPTDGRRNYKKVVKALRAAGVPYKVPKRKLRHSIGSAIYQLALTRKAKPGYTKEEVEDAEAEQQ